ncbi:hypothetical protein BJX63DRAFT_60948 [Aspergillus granulosus]|uniref:Zn(2)-C6 fungal-type domain-containing protein n=1 Tax=Aspergillus granulosus TaxID=176169 RepID=A0ABR4GXH8_9EURO
MEQTERRSRATKLKVRTGCITCKIRRVKCDEGKPSCSRCVSTGRKCDGYASPGITLDTTLWPAASRSLCFRHRIALS